MHSKKARPTRAYLLRCWQEGEAPPGEKGRWRFSLEEVLHKRPRQGFDSLEALIACVQAELDDERSTIENTDEKLNRGG